MPAIANAKALKPESEIIGLLQKYKELRDPVLSEEFYKIKISKLDQLKDLENQISAVAERINKSGKGSQMLARLSAMGYNYVFLRMKLLEKGVTLPG